MINTMSKGVLPRNAIISPWNAKVIPYVSLKASKVCLDLNSREFMTILQNGLKNSLFLEYVQNSGQWLL